MRPWRLRRRARRKRLARLAGSPWAIPIRARVVRADAKCQPAITTCGSLRMARGAIKLAQLDQMYLLYRMDSALGQAGVRKGSVWLGKKASS